MDHGVEPLSRSGAGPSSRLGAALGVAIGSEELAAERYRELAGMVDSQARPALLALAADATRNAKQLREIACATQAALNPQQVLATRLCSEGLQNSILLPELGSDPSEDEVLHYAEIRERLAYDYYSCLARLSPPGPLQDLVVQLRDEKRRHEQEVQRCCAALFLIW